MSRFKHRKFDVICDSNGTNCWIPVEQAKALLCDAMAVEAENERLRKAGDAVTLCLCADTDEQHKRRCAINWLAAKEGRDAK